jgi:cytochrome c oxidase subunit 2
MQRLLIAVLLSASVWAGVASAEGDPAAGKAYFAVCSNCHGDQAQGNVDTGAPRLTHLREDYIVNQLAKFKARTRGGEGAGPHAMQMSAIAATLPDEQAMWDVASYIGSLEDHPAAETIEGDAELGADYYNQYCGACHGAQAQGNPSIKGAPPPLIGANDWYLVRQLEEFRRGGRGAHSEDSGGKKMAVMAGVLPDEQAIYDVVTYIHSLSN